ncbi:MAG: SusD/RagB family nutrient-binding outer membrane lipoprotein [Chryseolinea sp.]
MKKIFSLLILFLTLSGCKDFLDVNTDPNNPLDVKEALLLSTAELSISRNLMSGNAAWICQNFMQMSALNQPNPQVGTYRLLHSDVDGDWTLVYSEQLVNLRIMIDKAEKNNNFHYSAVGKILTAFTLGTATDLWGDIPYSQALSGTGNLLPVYDKQEDIYNDIQSLLDDGIADIAKSSAKAPGTDDYFYQGDMTQWQKVAYTLKARYAMHLTKAPGHTAVAQADLALQFLAKGMISNDDDLKMLYPGTSDQANGWWTNFNPVSTSCMSSYFVDSLVARNDPRLPIIVSPAVETGLYTGRVIGTDAGVLETYSSPTDLYGGIGATNDILTYSEELFLKAEATLIKSGFAAAEPIYQEGIVAHMSKLGVSDADINAYLATRGTLTTDNALQRIMEEKNVANFLNIETFTDWRRTGFPALTIVPEALSDIPRRLIYPQVEMIRNPQPQHAAQITDPVWWDQQ